MVWPLAARCSAVALPKPEEAPVMRIILFIDSVVMFG